MNIDIPKDISFTIGAQLCKTVLKMYEKVCLVWWSIAHADLYGLCFREKYVYPQ